MRKSTFFKGLTKKLLRWFGTKIESNYSKSIAMIKPICYLLSIGLLFQSCASSTNHAVDSRWRAIPNEESQLSSPFHRGISYATTEDYMLTLQVYSVTSASEQFTVNFINKTNHWVDVNPTDFSMTVVGGTSSNKYYPLSAQQLNTINENQRANSGAQGFFWTLLIGGGLIWLMSTADGDPYALQTGQLGMPAPESILGRPGQMLSPSSIAPGDTLQGSLYFKAMPASMRTIHFEAPGLEPSELQLERVN